MRHPISHQDTTRRKWAMGGFFLMAAIAMASCSSDKPTYLEPHLSTLAATDVTRTEATLNGTVHVEGDTDMPQLRFKYGTNTSMTETSTSANIQGFSASLHLENLTAGTTYYYMLQGSNGRTTITSNMMDFTTLPNEKPTLGEATILSHGPMSTIVGYEIKEDGGENITETGCYYNLVSESTNAESEKPNETSSKIVLDNYNGNIGNQKLLITNLLRNATYQISPYAKSRVGETIGSPITFTTSDAIVLNESGELSTLLGDNLYEYTTLSLAGPMNGDDLCCLRKMMGRNSDESSTPGKLSQLDMTDVKIVAGGGTYGASRYTQDHVVGQGLFANCTHLTQVSLPVDATTLEKDAFAGCTALTQIEISASITLLQPSSGCTALQEIQVSSANTKYSSQDGVLLNDKGTEIVWFPMGKQGEYTLPSTITSVSDYAFKECSIESFNLSDGLTTIGQGAFMDSKVKEVKLPANLRTVPTSTFQGCTLLKTVRLGSKTELISDYAFDNCPLTDIYVDAKLPPICSEHAFSTRGTSIFNTCTIHVPTGKANLYKNAAGWKLFKNIIAD